MVAVAKGSKALAGLPKCAHCPPLWKKREGVGFQSHEWSYFMMHVIPLDIIVRCTDIALSDFFAYELAPVGREFSPTLIWRCVHVSCVLTIGAKRSSLRFHIHVALLHHQIGPATDSLRDIAFDLASWLQL